MMMRLRDTLLGVMIGASLLMLAVQIDTRRERAMVRDLSDALDGCRADLREAACCCDVTCEEASHEAH